MASNVLKKYISFDSGESFRELMPSDHVLVDYKALDKPQSLISPSISLKISSIDMCNLTSDDALHSTLVSFPKCWFVYRFTGNTFYICFDNLYNITFFTFVRRLLIKMMRLHTLVVFQSGESFENAYTEPAYSDTSFQDFEIIGYVDTVPLVAYVEDH